MRWTPIFFLCLLYVIWTARVSTAAPVTTTGLSWQTVLDQNDRTLTYSFDTTGGYAVEGYASQSLEELFATIPQWRDLIRQELDAWSVAADITFVEVPDSGDAFGTAGARGAIRFSAHPMAVDTHAHADLPLATGTTEAEAGTSYSGDLHYNTDFPWGTTDLQADTLHELGHSLGLAHNLDIESTMFPWSVAGVNVTTPSEHDLADLRAIYFPQNLPAPVLVSPVVAAERDWFAVADGTAEAHGTVAITDSGRLLTSGEQKTGIKGIGASLADENYGFDYVDLRLEAGGRIETAGHNAYGIGAGDFNTLRVDGLITTAGYSADGIALLGRDNSLQTGATSLIRTSGASGNGIFVGGEQDALGWPHGNLVVANGRIETSGNGACGIFAAGYSELTLNGSISTTGSYAAGIGSDYYGHQHILMKSGATIDTGGSNGYGILARGAANLVTMDGTITTTGSDGYGIYGYSAESATMVIGGSIITSGESGYGVYTEGNDNVVTSSGSIVTAGTIAPGMLASGTGNYLENSGSIATSGQSGYGIYASGNDNVVTSSGSIATSGQFGYGLYLSAANNKAVNDGTIQTEGWLGHGMVARGGGNILVHSGTIETTGEDAYGVFAREGGNILDISGDILSRQAAAVRVGSFWNSATNMVEQAEATGNLLLLHGAPQIVGDIINDGADNGAIAYFGVTVDDTVPGGYAAADTDLAYTGSFSGRSWLGEVVAGRVSLNGAQNAFSTLTVYSGATLGGNTTLAGDLVNAGYVAPGNSIGTITVAGDYLQSAGATLLLEIGGSSSDQLLVGGDATFLDGSLLAVSPIAPMLSGDFSLLRADGTLSGSPQLTLADSALLDFTLNSGSQNLTLQVARTAYADLAASDNQRQLAAALDRLVAGASGDLADALLQIDALEQAAAVRQALDSLAPTAYAALPDAVLGALRGFIRTMPTAERYPLAGEDGWRAHAQLIGVQRQTGPGDGVAGYQYDSRGFVAGADRSFDGYRLGAALSYQDLRIDHDDSRSRSDADVLFAALRGGLQSDFWYLRGLLGYGHQWHDTRRDIQVAGLTRQADSHSQSDTLFAGLEGGLDIPIGRFSLTPFAGLDYAACFWGGFDETNAGTLNVKIDDATAESLRSSLGLALAAPIAFGSTFTLDTRLRLAWSHELGDDAYAYGVRMQGQNFSMRGQDLGRDLLLAGLGLQSRWSKKVAVHVGIDYERRRDDDGFSAQGGLSCAF
ncbi:MAG: autotransporter domain-containing protein [Pedobacter sp.]